MSAGLFYWIVMNTLHQLTEAKFQEYLDSLGWVKRKLADNQRKFEALVLNRGYSFPDGYHYVKGAIEVDLICPRKHPFRMQPSSFKGGRRCPQCQNPALLGFRHGKPVIKTEST